MRRLVALALTVCGAALAATVPDLFYPTPQAAQTACDAGYAQPQSEESDSPHDIDLDPAGTVRLQPPVGSFFHLCRNYARAARPKPDVSALRLPALVYVSGRAPDLAEARQYAATLLVRDAAGKQLGRLAADETRSRVAREPDWRIDCSAGPCAWAGSNTYHFVMGSAKLRADLEAGNRLFVSVRRGNKVEEFPVPDAALTPNP